MGLDLTYESDYKTFLRDSDEPDDWVRMDEYKSHCKQDDPSTVAFRGMSLEDIQRNKFSYKQGVENIKKLDAVFQIGSKKIHHKWDEFDGDDMSMERMYDGFAPMRKRDYQHGQGRQGKFITLNVCIGENSGVTAEQLNCRALLALRIVDHLETLNYRVAVNVYTDVGDLGWTEDGTPVDSLHTQIIIKKENEPLIMPLLATCISPWMFRYHIFKFWYAKFKASWGLGHTIKPKYKDDDTTLYIRAGECLDMDSVKKRLQEIEEKYK